MALRSAFGCLAQCLQEKGLLDAGELADRIQGTASLQAYDRLRTALEEIADTVVFECELPPRPAHVAPVLRLVGKE